ncbi:presenilin-like protein At1g08700 [Rutidosis leptorrhynchoides]|uniref:presenilin-like protein At1g08700 n=1 Tax=Rutidosis leptorrhynchoides TaxID=125765 RepID=UPI003A99D408
MDGSILSSIGTEIIGVMSPVSICMLIVVLLVYSQSSISVEPIQTAANLVYLETPSDSTSQKIEGSLLNALVFVILIAVVTFLLVLLYYYNFTNFLKNYMRFSAFFVLAFMGGSICISIIRQFSIPVDVITCVILLFNFTVVGVLSIFAEGVPIPIVLRQVYMVVLGIIVAAWFTNLPEWTTWTLLVALALYDLVAVLAPGGPLKILVELASSRDDELPALVYEARPTVSTNPRRSSLGLLVGGVSSDSVEIEMTQHNGDRNEVNNDDESAESSPLVPSLRDRLRDSSSEIVEGDVEMTSLAEMDPQMRNEDVNEEMTRGIKLGLGDFVFYSVLVGRAAMFDLMTVYACYLAIISGLGCTLILLSVFRQALPALPISIALGIMFYFLTRLLMEPFVVGASTNLLMF